MNPESRIVFSLVAFIIAGVGMVDAKKFLYRSRVSDAVGTELTEFGRVLMGLDVKKARRTKSVKAAELSDYLEESLQEWGTSLSFSLSLSLSMAFPDKSFPEELEWEDPTDVDGSTAASPEEESTPATSSSTLLSCGEGQEDGDLGNAFNASYSIAAETKTENPDFIPALEKQVLENVASLVCDGSSRRYLKGGIARKLSVVAVDTTSASKSSETCVPADESNFCTVIESALTVYVENEEYEEAQQEVDAAIQQAIGGNMLDTSLWPDLVEITLIGADNVDIVDPTVAGISNGVNTANTEDSDDTASGAGSLTAGAAVAIGGATVLVVGGIGLLVKYRLSTKEYSSEDSLSKNTEESLS